MNRDLIKQKFGGKCAYCGCELSSKWHADHTNAVFRRDGKFDKPENHTEDKIYPACAPCNLFKATFTIEEFRREITFQADRARRYSVNFRTAERFGQIETKQKPVIFWFETFNGVHN